MASRDCPADRSRCHRDPADSVGASAGPNAVGRPPCSPGTIVTRSVLAPCSVLPGRTGTDYGSRSVVPVVARHAAAGNNVYRPVLDRLSDAFTVQRAAAAAPAGSVSWAVARSAVKTSCNAAAGP